MPFIPSHNSVLLSGIILFQLENFLIVFLIVRYAGKKFAHLLHTWKRFLFYVYFWRKLSLDTKFQVGRFFVLFPIYHYINVIPLPSIPLVSIISADMSNVAPLMAMHPPHSTLDAFTIFCLWSKELKDRIQSNPQIQRIENSWKETAREGIS